MVVFRCKFVRVSYLKIHKIQHKIFMEQQTNNTINVTTTRAGIRYGLIFGLISVISMLFEYMTKSEKIFGMFDWIYFVAMVVMALLYYRSNNNGLMTYKQGLSTGMAATGIASILAAFAHLLYTTIIDTDYTKNQLDLARIELEKNPNLTDEQISQVINMSNIGAGGTFLAMVFGLLLFGLIISLIVAAILKKESEEF